MNLISVILLAIGLAMDCLAVSSMKGVVGGKRPWLMAILFGLFQGGMPLIGYAAGSAFASVIDRFDHWIALVLLTFIGGKMIWESFHEPTENTSKSDGSIAELLTLAVATSIDALATGVIFVPYSWKSVLLDMVLQDIIGRLWHGTMIIALHLVERHVLMACQLQHAPEVGLFLITSEEFQLSVA